MPPNDPNNPNSDNDIVLEQIRQLRNELEKTREHVRSLGADVGELSREIKKTYETLQKQIEESLKTSFSNSQVQSSVQRALTDLGLLAGEAFSRALNTAVERGIGDINVGQMQTTLGAMSSSIANIVGVLVGGATTAFTANPVMGAAAGVTAQQLTSQVAQPLTSFAGMQLEGYRMMGARVLPLTGQNFMQYAQDLKGVGAEYQRTLVETRLATGATEQEIAQLIRTFAQLGIGFLEGSRDIVQYNLALERMFNLRPGTILQTETVLVKQFGQSINDIKPIVEGMRESVQQYEEAYKNFGNTTAGAFKTMQLFIDAMMQTTSAARTSGASLDTLLTLSKSLIDTMVVGEGKGLFRPEHMVQGAGNLLQLLTPPASGTITSSAPTQGMVMNIIQQTEFGRNLLQRFQEIQKERGLAPGPAQLGLAADFYIRSGNTQERGLQYAFSILSGLQEMMRGPQGKTGVSMLLGGMHIDQREVEMLFQHIDDLTKKGVFSAQDPFAMYKEIVAKEPQKLDLTKQVLEAAGQIAPETLSAMDKAALGLTKLSTYFAGGEYLRDSRDIVQFMRGIETGTAALARGVPEAGPVQPYGVSEMVGPELQRLIDEPKSPAVSVEPEVNEETSQDFAIAEDKMCFPPEAVGALESQKTAMNSALCNAGIDY